MTERKLENIIADKLRALGFECICSTFGNNEEDETASAVVTIDTGTRSQAMWEIPQYDIPFTLTLEQRIETDADKSAYLENVEKITDLLAPFCSRGGRAALTDAFTIADEFSPVYFQLNGGTNEVDREASVYTFEQSFTLRGIIK